MGPSLGAVMAVIITRSPSRSTVSLLRVWTKEENPRSLKADRSSSVGNSGSRTVVDLGMSLASSLGSKWSRCRCDMYKKSGLKEAKSTSLLSGNTNQEAK